MHQEVHRVHGVKPFWIFCRAPCWVGRLCRWENAKHKHARAQVSWTTLDPLYACAVLKQDIGANGIYILCGRHPCCLPLLLWGGTHHCKGEKGRARPLANATGQGKTSEKLLCLKCKVMANGVHVNQQSKEHSDFQISKCAINTYEDVFLGSFQAAFICWVCQCVFRGFPIILVGIF